MIKNNRPECINLLELVPKRNISWENKEEVVILLKPKFKNPFLAKHLLPRMKKPFYKIKLDEIGSAVWILCDGHRSVKKIGDLLHAKFGEKAEPLFDRLSMFFQSLERNKFIVF